MNDAPRPARRARWLAAATLVATFLVGAVVGIAYERMANPSEARTGRDGERRERPSLFAPNGALGSRLNLTEQQRDSIEAIVDRERRKSHDVFEEIKPRLRARYDTATAAIRTVLTPEQQAEYDRFHEERHDKMRRKYGSGRERDSAKSN